MTSPHFPNPPHGVPESARVTPDAWNTAADLEPLAGPGTQGDRWANVRSGVRALVARRLSPSLAAELLPRAAAEPEPDAHLPLALETSMPWEQVAAAYPALLAQRQRKQHGTWFSSQALAAPTAARTLAPLLARSPASLRIVDPAVGGGTFLLAALRELRAAGLPAREAVACLHGVDVDGTAAALAALAIWSAAELPADDLCRIKTNVRAGDGLLDLPAGTFDAVLTNPPWETLQGSPHAPAQVARLRPHFRHQGPGKLYTYRLFVERSHQLLRAGGRFGLIVPASLWFDRDAAPLRDLLLDDCAWEWLFGFENTKKLFPIDSRYRFAIVVGEKGRRTESVRAAFGRTDAADWAAPAPRHVLYGAAQLRTLSKRSGAFVEIEDGRDLDILQRMAAAGRALTGSGGALLWRQGDYNMTSDRATFVLRSDAECSGWRHRGDGVWRRAAGGGELLPLYQGAMLYDLHPNTGAHARGVGHATAWEAPAGLSDFRPQYLVPAEPWRAAAHERPRARIVLRALSNATNERTAVACLLPDVPCGNSLGVLVPREPVALPLRAMAAGAAVLGSLPFDWSLRLRLSGINLNGFVLEDCMVPRLDDATERELARLALRLCAVLPWHAGLWDAAREEGWGPAVDLATTATERAELLTQIDVLVGRAFGLTRDDVQWIVRGCDTQDASARHAKGFWRVDRSLPPANRRPNRWLAALA